MEMPKVATVVLAASMHTKGDHSISHFPLLSSAASDERVAFVDTCSSCLDQNATLWLGVETRSCSTTQANAYIADAQAQDVLEDGHNHAFVMSWVHKGDCPLLCLNS